MYEQDMLTSQVTSKSIHKFNSLNEILELDDGSCWIQLSNHDCRSKLFSSTDDFANKFVYHNNKCWSTFHLINHLARPNNEEYEFMSIENTMDNNGIIIRRWAQKVNPLSTNECTDTDDEHNKVAASNAANNGFRAIENMLDNMGGLRRNGTQAFFKLAVNGSNSTNGSPAWWYGAFGSWTGYTNGTLPVAMAIDGTEYNTPGILNLYMRINPTEKRYREFKNGIIMPTTINEM